MVISDKTYHIVGNVPLDRLQLATIIDSLQDPMPLNDKQELKIEQERLYCTHTTDYKATRAQTLKGEAGVGLKLLSAGGGGGEASAGVERAVDEAYSFGGLDTLFFYPERSDYEAAIKQSSALAEFVETSDYAPVYMITGIKTARRPMATSLTHTRNTQVGMKIAVGTEQLGIPTLSLGPKVSASKTGTIKQESGELSEDYVFAVRVRKLCYRRRYLGGLLGSRQWTNAAYNRGAELVGVDRESIGKQYGEDEPLFDVEELELGEDEILDCAVEETEAVGTRACEREVNRERITWVVPKP